MKKDFFADKAKTWNDHPFKTKMVETFFNYVMSNIRIEESSVILDFGCGTGLIGFSLIDFCQKVIFVDNSPAMLSVLSDKLQEQTYTPDKFSVHAGDINTYSGEKADLIVSHMVLHHCEEIDTVIKGCFEALKPGGKVIMVDLKTEDGSFHAPEGCSTQRIRYRVPSARFRKRRFQQHFNRGFPSGREGRRTIRKVGSVRTEVLANIFYKRTNYSMSSSSSVSIGSPSMNGIRS